MLETRLKSLLPTIVAEQLQHLKYCGLPEPFRTVRPYSMLSYINLFFLQELARRIERSSIGGDFVECGVFRGGSAGVLGFEATHSKLQRHVWLYDSFEGMPAASKEDDEYSWSLKGQFVGSEAQVHRIMRRLEVPISQYTVNTGYFETTLREPTVQDVKVALLHVDCDFYEPVRSVLDCFYDQVEPGGFVVLNDYGSFQGCRQATNELLDRLEAAGRKVALIPVDNECYYFQK